MGNDRGIAKRSLINIFCFILEVCVLVFIVPRVFVFFLPFVVGWIISMIANPLVRFLEHRLKIVRRHSSVIIIVVVLVLIITGGYFAIAKIAQEISSFLESLPQLYGVLVTDIEDIRENLQGVSSRLPLEWRVSVQGLTQNFVQYLGNLAGALGAPTMEAAGTVARNIGGALIHVIFTFLSAYFFIAEREHILEFLRRHIRKETHERWNFVVSRFKSAIGGYFKAQFKIMGIVAIILLVGFLILHIGYAVLLAVLIAFLDMLPFFGTGTALIPWALFKVLSGDYRFAAGLIVIYVVSQLVRQLIQPKIVGDSIGLDPMLTLIFMFIGYKLSSIFGMIIAVPVGMILVQLYQAGAFDGILSDIRELMDWIRKQRSREEYENLEK